MTISATNARTFPQEDPSFLVSVADVVASLRDLFGQSLTAQIAGIQDPETVGEWAGGRIEPDDDIARRLRAAWGIAGLLLAVDRPSVVRAWFGGQNRMLGDRPPALVLHTDPEADWRAARAFRAYG